MKNIIQKNIPAASALIAILALSACGGSGTGTGAGTSPTLPLPAATPPPPPPPPPPPTGPVTTPPPPGTNFDTAEFRRSDGPEFHGAIAAYEVGATGDGIIVGVIDTGIDPDSRDFAGRISDDSIDVTGLNRGLQTLDGHGATVSRIIGAARDNSGIHGIAFDSTILTLRSDTEGTCEGSGDDEPGCTFNNNTLAAALNAAVDAGARIVNLSLGGPGGVNTALRMAIERATAANIVIVISAGNEGNPDEDEEPAFDPDNPSPFAQAFLANGNGNVIISTSVTDDREISDFSNRAGDSQNSVLSALGSSICCLFEDDEILITTDEEGNRFINVFNGTSFSAPQISGAAALLAQAFPNLSAVEIVDILLQSADDAGDAGTDAVFGRGILNIASAFQPIGTTSLASTSIALPTTSAAGSTGPAMGDAGLSSEPLNAIITDDFDRPFEVNLGAGIITAQQNPRLTQGLINNGRAVALNAGPAQIAFNISQDSSEPIRGLNLSESDERAARIIAGRITAKLAADTSISLGIRQSAQAQLALLQGQSGSSFLIARNANFDSGFIRSPDGSFALRQNVSGFGLTLSAEAGQARVLERNELQFGAPINNRYGYGNVGFALDRSIGKAWLSLGANLLNEEETVLGARFNSAIGRGGAQSIFLNADGRYNLGKGFNLNAAWREGWTDARSTLNSGGTIDGSGQIRSNSFSFDVSKAGLFGTWDRIGLRIAQPTRVTSGGLNLNVPISFDFATESATFGIRQLNLAPQGREIATELSYFFPIKGGTVSTNFFYRQEPGHFENAPDDIGAAIRFTFGL